MNWQITIDPKKDGQPTDIVIFQLTSPDKGFVAMLAVTPDVARIIGASFRRAADECSSVIVIKQ